jgi:hypothetical protein
MMDGFVYNPVLELECCEINEHGSYIFSVHYLSARCLVARASM